MQGRLIEYRAELGIFQAPALKSRNSFFEGRPKTKTTPVALRAPLWPSLAAVALAEEVVQFSFRTGLLNFGLGVKSGRTSNPLAAAAFRNLSPHGGEKLVPILSRSSTLIKNLSFEIVCVLRLEI